MAEHGLDVTESRLGPYEGLTEEMTQGNDFRRCAGFTLVELIVITAIIGVLAAIAIPAYSRFVEKTKVTRAVAEIRALEKDLLASMVDSNTLPNSLNDIGRGTLRDPWGKPYQYLKIPAREGLFGQRLNNDFDLYSQGPDDQSNLLDITDDTSKDDVVRAGDGGWVGLGADF